MAQRLAFYEADNKVLSRIVEFEWMSGLSVAQKKRSMRNMHSAIAAKTLEVSTKSDEALGVRMSAFNLSIDGVLLECVFQSSKCFTNGGPYRDILNLTPKEAKRDERLKTSGQLTGFDYDGFFWNKSTGTAFYDYLYVKAIRANFSNEEINQLVDYDFFTDIEFNHNKSLNTQARSAALVKAMVKIFGDLPEINSPSDFLKIHSNVVRM